MQRADPEEEGEGLREWLRLWRRGADHKSREGGNSRVEGDAENANEKAAVRMNKYRRNDGEWPGSPKEGQVNAGPLQDSKPRGEGLSNAGPNETEAKELNGESDRATLRCKIEMWKQHQERIM